MRGGTELAREIQLTDWSTAGEQGKMVLCIRPSQHSGAICFNFSQRKKKMSFERPKHYTSIQVLHFKISVKKKRTKQIRFDKSFLSFFLSFFFVTSTQFVANALGENLSNRSSLVQKPHDICTRFRRYFYSTKYEVQLDNKDTYSFEPSLCIHLLLDKSNCLSSRYPFPDLYEAPAILLYDKVSK